MDDIAAAFELPQARAAAAAAQTPLDRISVRDHVREVEIGAYRAERGITQRVRFTVVLEVAPGLAGQADDVDRVLSYERIVEAIDAALAAERLNLLETLAERVAAGCLADPRAARAFVRVEKLDRIPGALGVEIVRTRLPQAAARLHAPVPPAAAPAPKPLVVHLPPALLAGPEAGAWLDAVAALPAPGVLALGPAAPEEPAAAEGAWRAGVLAIEAAAWRLADRDPRFTVAESRSELDWALGSGRRPVWAPARMLAAALPRPAADASAPAALAAWLAGELGAARLVLAAPAPAEAAAAAALAGPAGVALREAAVPAELAA